MIIRTLADAYTKPGQAQLFSNPKEFGLDYEEVQFKAEDGVTIKGWLIKGGTDKVVVHSHFGCVSCRVGYTPEGKGRLAPWDKEINFLRQAKYLVEDGYSVLMFDFRNHGDSDNGSLPWITIGPEENKDVMAAVNYISQRNEYKEANIALLSICMGSGATMFAYGREDGLSNYDKIKAFVSVQPVNFDISMKTNGIPGFITNRVNKEMTKRVGYDLTKESFLPYVEKVTVPTMVIQNENDPWTEISHVKDIYSRLKVDKEYVNLKLENKRFAAYDYIGSHSQEILGFLDKHMK